jgi:hypothetical protein
MPDELWWPTKARTMAAAGIGGLLRRNRQAYRALKAGKFTVGPEFGPQALRGIERHVSSVPQLHLRRDGASSRGQIALHFR